MKINKLIIHNIASIEDATIDFNGDLLKSTDLFLITGTTGAGKTTILDAICLALFKTTPRLSKGGGNDHINSDELTGSDSRNIMRSNTGYAFVKLYFTGNDRREYIAEWSVQRGKNMLPGQNLSKAVWSLTDVAGNVVTSGAVSNAYKEVEAAIHNVIGLDFNQFCRTTMLAQGEFTEFLKSDEKSKAAILEKISGTGIYRKIGQEIYSQCTTAEKKYNDERKTHEAIKPMEEPDRKAKEDRIVEIEQLLDREQKDLDNIAEMIDWMLDMCRADKNIQKWKEKLEEDDAAVKTEEFARNQKLVQEWNETAEARESYRAALEQKEKKSEAERNLDALELEYKKALSGEAYLMEEKLRLSTLKSIVEGRIEAEKDNVQAYAMEQAIISNINNLTSKEVSIKTDKESHTSYTLNKLPEAEEKAASSLEKATLLKTKADKVKAELDDVTRKLKEMDLPALRKEREELAAVEKCRCDIAGSQRKVEEALTSVQTHKEKLPLVQQKADEESAELKRLFEEQQRRFQSMEDATKKMRSVLQARLGQEDNTCPVCGQIVTSIKADEVFAEEYRKIKEEYDAQADRSESANKALSALTSSIESEEGMLKKLESELKGFLEALRSLPVDGSMKDLGSEAIAQRIQTVTAAIENGSEVEKQLNELHGSHTTLLDQYSSANEQALNDRNAVELIRQDIKRLAENIRKESDEAEMMRGDITKALAGTLQWENDWQEDPKRFIEELRAKSKAYSDNESTVTEANRKIAGIDPLLSGICKMKESIGLAMPDWKAENIQSMEITDIQDVWVKLNGNIEAQRQALKAASENYGKLMGVVQKFLLDNSQYNFAEFDALNLISTVQKERIADENVRLIGKRDTSKAQYETALEWKADRAVNKPEGFADEITVEELEAQKAAISEERDHLSEEKGKLIQELKEDDALIAKKKDRTLLDKLAAEAAKWAAFSKKYGDKEGNTLSMIAQSFVLESLLKTANHHLQNMAPRYRLLVNPGTLILKLEDQLNCETIRDTNSMSGGESFLVSLALALALADFGQHLGVSTLFIDEGFGTLSGEHLQSAINTLKALHSDAGRQVGIISHREEVQDNIPVQVRVKTARGTSVSTIEVVDNYGK